MLFCSCFLQSFYLEVVVAGPVVPVNVAFVVVVIVVVVVVGFDHGSI